MLVFIIMFFGVKKIMVKKVVVETDGRLPVATSFYPLYYFVSEVGGSKVRVENITPAGVEPHDYEPTARDIMSLQRTKILFLNGGNFEAWGEKVKEDLKSSGIPVVEVSKGLLVENDPHVWLSPELVKKQLAIIITGLIQVDPRNADYYSKNGTILSVKMDKLQQEYKKGLANCRKKEFVTSHTAFGYLSREFGLTQVAIAGMAPDAEPSTKQLAEIAKFAKEKELKYIFFERLVSPKLAETVAEEIGAKTLVLDPIEGISDNDMKQGKNYLTVMEENLINLRVALECK